MADPKRPSLTVLGGPMAGTRFVIDESFETIILGSDETCDFRLSLPGVAPMHARLIVEGSGVTIQDAGSDGGLHVNDNPVLETGTALRNGDIVWLGSPGEPEVVMLQCILPRAPSPAPPAPESGPTEDETLALAPETLFSAEPASAEPATEMLEASEPEPPAAALTEILDIAREAMGGEQEFVVAEETVAMPGPAEPIESDAPPTTIMTSAEFEDETVEMSSPSVSFPEEPAGTVVIDATDVASPSFAVPAEEPTAFYSGTEPEPTEYAPPPPEPGPTTHPEPPKTTVLPRPAPRPPLPARPEAPRAAKPAAPAPRPAPKPRPAPEAPAVSRPSSGAPVGLYAAIGLAALVVIGVGAWGAMRFMRSKPAAAPTPAPVAQVTPLPPPISTLAAPSTPAPAISQEPVDLPTPLAATPPPVAATPTPRPSATPSAAASPSPSPRKGAPTPAPTAAGPVAPSGAALRAAQVATLLGQADASLAARQYDAALGHLDEVLRLDPGNAKAAADRTSALALRDAARKRFVPGRTVVKTEKASGGLAGFDTGDVALQKSPDFLGRIDFEMSPASGIEAGEGYSLKIILVNEGKKAIRIQGLTVSTVVNGSAAGAPTTARVREVQPQQRAELGEVTGSWKDGTTSWSAEVLVTANKGDSLKNTISWR